MTVNLVLKNGTVISQGKEVMRSVAIDAGDIEGIYSPGSEPQAEKEVDCRGLYILPGAIDIHVHLRDLRQSDKEDYVSGTMAAAAGGVTTVIDMPNSVPPILGRKELDQKIRSAKAKRFVNIGFYAGIPRKTKDFDIEMLPDILGIKVYPHAPLSEGTRYTPSRIRACMRLSAKHNIPLLLHPDASKPHSNPKTLDKFFELHSCENETKSLGMFLEEQDRVGGRLHVCHVSCAASTRLILEHRAEEDLTAEVTPHHLFLTSADFPNNDGVSKFVPPLRSPHDTEVLRDALSKCTIDCVASDHAPHLKFHKEADFLEAAAGIPGLETTVPLMLTEVFQNRLSWVEYLRCCCSAPARIMGLSDKGVLGKGYDADIIAVERGVWKIRETEFHSKAKYSPFDGRKVLGRTAMTIVGGEIVYKDGGFFVGPGTAGRVPVRKSA